MTGIRTLLDRTFGLPDLPALPAGPADWCGLSVARALADQLDVTRHCDGATTTMTMNIPVAQARR